MCFSVKRVLLHCSRLTLFQINFMLYNIVEYYIAFKKVITPQKNYELQSSDGNFRLFLFLFRSAWSLRVCLSFSVLEAEPEKAN